MVQQLVVEWGIAIAVLCGGFLWSNHMTRKDKGVARRLAGIFAFAFFLFGVVTILEGMGLVRQ